MAQKRLALQLEKLQVDKQLVREEKKALRARLPKELEKTEKVWKQVSRKQQQELEQYRARIHELETTLLEKERAASPQTKRDRDLQNQVDDLQTQLQKEHDDHEAIVEELKMKLSEQEKELQGYQQGNDSSLSVSKKDSDSYAIQQYKSKLASLRLAMEVAVRHTETEWKTKVDELEVALATQEGEFEELQAQHEEHLEHAEKMKTQLMDLQIQFEARENAYAEERKQMEETIKHLESEQKAASALVDNLKNEEQGTSTSELEMQLAALQAKMKAREQFLAKERKELQETIERLKSEQQVVPVATAITADEKGEFDSATDPNNELQKTRDELVVMRLWQEECLQSQERILKDLRALLTGVYQVSPEEFEITEIRRKTMALEEEVKTLERKMARRPSTAIINTTSIKNSFQRRSSSQEAKEVKKNVHVSNLEWTGANQKGKYTGYVDEHGEPDGRGKLEVENGDVYEGEWKNGKRHGQGIYTWAQGDLYTGPWRKNKRHGHGVFVWSDGRLYDGEYNMGKREGKGIFTWPYGAKYEGEYKDNKRNGHGVYVKADGETYTGEYLNDRPHGRGVQTDSKGKVLCQGKWSHGQFIGESGSNSIASF